MLNIPSEVKALFALDDCYKNFHVHFPNGEVNDLNNDSIVTESVRFAESLCSQQYFKFGLSEASSIEFECVGLPNVRGAVIDCAIEIDVTSLGDAFITAHPIDATLDFLEPQTVRLPDNRYGYRVPYGKFVIDTCPRSQSAMKHRQITAYTLVGGETIKNPFETEKCNLLLPGDTYEPDISLLVMSSIGYKDSGFLESQGFTKTELPSYDPHGGQTYPFFQNTLALKTVNNESVTLTFHVSYHRASNSAGEIYPNSLYSVDLHGVDYSEAMTNAIEELQAEDIDCELSGYNSWEELFDAAFGNWYKPSIMYQGSHPTPASIGIDFDSDNYAFYPFRSSSISCSAIVPRSVTIYDKDSRPHSIFSLGSDKQATFYRYTKTLSQDIKVTFKSTLKQGKLYSFANAFSLTDFTNDYLEIAASFCKPSRGGNNELVMLDNSAPFSVSKSNWSEFWWDENDISPIGKVQVAFKGKDEDDEEQTQTITLASGDSIYNMTDNDVLLSASLTSAEVKTLLQERFMPGAAAINFTPIEATIQGLPYLEAGDYITLTSDDNEQVNSFILLQEISGIQHLVTDITSTNGELEEASE